MNGMSELLRSLRATRRFQARAVPDDVVTEILEVARWTGSARNRQPWRVALIDDAGERRTLAALGAYADVLAGAPLVVVIAIDHRLGGSDAEFDAGRFAQTLMLAAHGRGVGSCPVSFFPDENVDAVTARIGLGPPWRARTAIALGYPRAPDPGPPGRSAIPTGRMPVVSLVIDRASAMDAVDVDAQ